MSILTYNGKVKSYNLFEPTPGVNVYSNFLVNAINSLMDSNMQMCGHDISSNKWKIRNKFLDDHDHAAATKLLETALITTTFNYCLFDYPGHSKTMILTDIKIPKNAFTYVKVESQPLLWMLMNNMQPVSFGLQKQVIKIYKLPIKFISSEGKAIRGIEDFECAEGESKFNINFDINEVLI